jgi:RNA-directed DNA polymerase
VFRSCRWRCTRRRRQKTGYRFSVLYDKISRADILEHAYAQCRSNKSLPLRRQGAHRAWTAQDFADIEACGVERWLAELALALRRETYRPGPIRRVFIPKVNGKLRPVGISTMRDRVGMTAAMLVLEPIFEADLPPEIYAYRAGRNAQQAAVEVEDLLFRGHPEVVDADLADYFGSIPHADLLKSVARRIVDRRVQGAGRRVRLLGLHVRTNVLSDDGPSPLGSAPLKEEYQAHGREGPCADRPVADMARNHNDGSELNSA